MLYEIIRQNIVPGSELSLFEVKFIPSLAEALIVGDGEHSNVFHMQLYPTAQQFMLDEQGRVIRESGAVVAPGPKGLFPDENPSDPYRREIVPRDNQAEADQNIRAYWQRKLSAAEKGKPYPRHHQSTINLQVAVGVDDAQEQDNGAGFSATTDGIWIDAHTNAANRYNAGFWFGSVTIPTGATIAAATLQVFVFDAAWDSPQIDIYANDVDNAATFTVEADVTSRVRTTASVSWAATNIGGGAFKSAPDIASVIQEVIDRAGWASGNALCVIAKGKNQAQVERFLISSYETAAAQAAKLDIDYSPADLGWRRYHYQTAIKRM